MDMSTSAAGRSRSKAVAAETGNVSGSRGTARRELVENEIYEQASRLFAERGVAGTSFQDIADAVGLTRPALYYYVKSKDDLLKKLISEITEVSAAEVRAVATRPDLDAAAKLHMIVRLSAVRLTAHPTRFQLLVRSEAELPSALAEAHLTARRAVLKSMTGVIDEGIAAGVFRPVNARVAALGVLGMGNWVAWWFHPGGRDNAEATADQLADMAVNSLRIRNGRPAEDPGAAIEMLRENLNRLELLMKQRPEESAGPAVTGAGAADPEAT
jgi:AcrR family transcriptional regulator